MSIPFYIYRKHNKRRNTPRFILVVFFLIFTSTFILSDKLQGKTPSPITAGDVEATRELKDRANVSETSDTTFSISIEALMAQIHRNPKRLPTLPPDVIDSETLWLARCIYSETKRPQEMELIAWVVRNRVETRYRGKHNYESVVLDRYQFSAFNPHSHQHRYYSNLGRHVSAHTWQTALTIAYGVRNSKASSRPFSITTRHFYSERSLINRPHPEWAEGLTPVIPARDFNIDLYRFRFFEGVS